MSKDHNFVVLTKGRLRMTSMLTLSFYDFIKQAQIYKFKVGYQLNQPERV